MSTDNPSARWLTVHDELLRGITHTLSNRIATIAAASYMYENGDVPIEHVTDSLKVESERMERLLQHLRLLPNRPDAEAEPLTANDACTAVLALHGYHPDFGDIAIHVTVDADVYPLWAEPQSFNHALLMAVSAANRNAAPGSRIAIRVSGDIRVVNIRAEAESAQASDASANERDAAAAGWLLTPFGGSARTVTNGCELQVPTLLAARRAQKEAR